MNGWRPTASAKKVLSAALASQGLTPMGGSVGNAETETPIHIAPALAGEREVAEQIIWSDPQGHVLRVKDVARVVREYDDPDSYIRNNGHRCVMLSMEMKAGFNIVQYGRDVDEVLHEFIAAELPADVQVQRIADQAKVVGDSVHSFLRDLFVAMAIIILVMMLLFPLRSAIVAAITIPLSTFISVGIMYLFGIPLNTVTLAALVVVLGMIVDNSIVVIDGYLDYLGRGHSRWFAAVESAREFFPSLLLATVCICMIFYPILFTMTGMMGDFLTYFPWTITINLMVSLLLAVLVIPFLEILIIPAVQPKKIGQVGHRPRTRPLPPRTGVDVPPRLADDLDGHRFGHRIAADRHATQAAHGSLRRPRPVRRGDLPAPRRAAGTHRRRSRLGLPGAARRCAREIGHLVRRVLLAALPDELRPADRR